MSGEPTNHRDWHELARLPAPMSKRQLWQALVDKTEHPERYNDAVRRAVVIEAGASTVVRRTYPGEGEPFLEWIRHEAHAGRVEYRRSGHPWKRAQAVVETPEGCCLVYEVDDPEAASRTSGVDSRHAAHVLQQLIAAAEGLEISRW